VLAIGSARTVPHPLPKLLSMVETDWLDAARLARWVRQQPEADRLESRSLEADRLRKWDKGGVVSVYVADRWLTKLQIPLLSLPPELAAEQPGRQTR
jgi:hypothetical protein